MSALWMSEAQYQAHQARVKGARTVTFVGNAGEKRGPKLAKTPKTPHAPQPKLSNEEMLALQMAEAGLKFERQWAWLKGRKYRADFGFPEQKLIVELEGAVHRIKARFKADILKSQDAVLNGFWLLRIGSDQVRMNSAVAIIKMALLR